MDKRKRRDRYRNQEAYAESENAQQVDQRKHEDEAQERPLVTVSEALALFHRIDGSQFANDNDKGREHEHERENDPRHD
jgi:hypothetical protein